MGAGLKPKSFPEHENAFDLHRTQLGLHNLCIWNYAKIMDLKIINIGNTLTVLIIATQIFVKHVADRTGLVYKTHSIMSTGCIVLLKYRCRTCHFWRCRILFSQFGFCFSMVFSLLLSIKGTGPRIINFKDSPFKFEGGGKNVFNRSAYFKSLIRLSITATSMMKY